MSKTWGRFKERQVLAGILWHHVALREWWPEEPVPFGHTKANVLSSLSALHMGNLLLLRKEIQAINQGITA